MFIVFSWDFSVQVTRFKTQISYLLVESYES